MSQMRADSYLCHNTCAKCSTRLKSTETSIDSNSSNNSWFLPEMSQNQVRQLSSLIPPNCSNNSNWSICLPIRPTQRPLTSHHRPIYHMALKLQYSPKGHFPDDMAAGLRTKTLLCVRICTNRLIQRKGKARKWVGRDVPLPSRSIHKWHSGQMPGMLARNQDQESLTPPVNNSKKMELQERSRPQARTFLQAKFLANSSITILQPTTRQQSCRLQTTTLSSTNPSNRRQTTQALAWTSTVWTKSTRYSLIGSIGSWCPRKAQVSTVGNQWRVQIQISSHTPSSSSYSSHN